MSVLDKFENRVEGAVDRAAGAVFKAPIEPAQIAKVAVKQMKQHRLVGAGRQYAPTLYNVLVNETDDKRLFGFYPTMAAEIETHLLSKGTDLGLEFDGRPLVRFITDPKLKRGRFDVIVENVSAQIIEQLREEEQEFYGIKPKQSSGGDRRAPSPKASSAAAAARPAAPLVDDDSLLPPHVAPATGAAGAAPATGAAGSALASLDPLQSAALLPPLPARRFANGAAARGGSASPAAARDLQAPDAALVGLDFAVSAEPSLGSAVLYNTTSRESSALLTRQVVLGRELDCGITVNDANASRQHVRLEQNALGSWKLVDLNSTNGTLLNGRPVSQAVLRDGDQITIGTTVLEFQQ
ncbi:MAG: FHA domain-containing protein [Coriobacteriales bacterium]|jgi:hypothetical protein|nr:FHA domain-containing protein [Coriobacteriales bacterium]